MIKDWFRRYAQGPKLLELCAYIAIAMVTILFIITHLANLAEWRFYATLFALAALLVLNIMWGFPKIPASRPPQIAQEWTFLILSALLILAMVWLNSLFDAAYLLSILCIQAGVKRGVWPAGVIFALCNLAAWLGLVVIMAAPIEVIQILARSLTLGIFYALLLTAVLVRYAQQTRRAESLLKDLQTAHAELAAAHQRDTQLAIAEERVRLARDIHDGLGHHLTVLSIQLQAAGKLLERDPRAASDAILACRAEAQAALEEVRDSVSVLRQSSADNHSLPESLALMGQSFSQHAGIPVAFECGGSPLGLSPLIEETFYRCVQEGLTNAQKHAKGVRQISVRLLYAPKSVQLWIEDDGQASPADTPSAGFGLQGLRERVSGLGGVFHCGQRPGGGFQIEICIPIQGREI